VIVFALRNNVVGISIPGFSPKRGDATVAKQLILLTVNGQSHELALESHWTLSQVLREQLGLTGTKEGCEEGACGSCTVIVDGQALPACMLLAVEQEGKSILTIEGLSKAGELHPIQEAWLQEHGAQCGYCSAGMIMSAKALLDKNPQPSDVQIKEALAGNICICSNYEHILNAVNTAADMIKRSADHG
jgi:aerobic-type carbon monoxide dehydrogenase small subunit (CoxS/CutS family)